MKSGGVRILAPDAAMLGMAKELMLKQRDTPMDLTDACLVSIAETKKIHTIFSFDRDFEIYRLHGRKRFTIIR